MLKIIKELLLKIIDSIDAGNSNITEKEAFERFMDNDFKCEDKIQKLFK